jgi:hypothetical protein
VNEYIVSVDIAKRRDFFGIMILRDCADIVPGNEALETAERVMHRYVVTHIEKYQGMDYTDMAERLRVLDGHVSLRNNNDLLVDGTGVGEPAVELVRKAGLYPVPIIFSPGNKCSEKYADFGQVFRNAPGQLNRARVLREISVPKKDLVAAGSILLQQRRVEVAKGRWSDEFRKQLMAFRGKVNENTRRVAYEAETESDHDDLVVCYLMAAWWIQNRRSREDIPERKTAGKGVSEYRYEPLDDLL